jgi:hypothetical protein
VFPEPDFAPEAEIVIGVHACLDGKPDVAIKFPLEPSVQGRKYETALAGDTYST